jgi:hypothetical protein
MILFLQAPPRGALRTSQHTATFFPVCTLIQHACHACHSVYEVRVAVSVECLLICLNGAVPIHPHFVLVSFDGCL